MVTPVVSVAITDKNEVLLVEHKPSSRHPVGYYGLPGGAVKLGESYEEAAVREVKEETGLEIDKSDLVKVGAYTINVERKIREKAGAEIPDFIVGKPSGDYSEQSISAFGRETGEYVQFEVTAKQHSTGYSATLTAYLGRRLEEHAHDVLGATPLPIEEQNKHRQFGRVLMSEPDVNQFEPYKAVQLMKLYELAASAFRINPTKA